MFDARRASSRSSAEQLAELQLLTRVDQQQGEAVRSLSVLQEGDEQEGDEDATDEIRIEMTTTPPTATSFTALLAASRRLVGSASSPPPPSMPETIQPSADKRSLSTLSETTELETTRGPETDADRTPNDTREPLADRDQAFEDMLQQLPYDASFLALSISDIKPRNLLRLRDALARGQRSSRRFNEGGSNQPRRPIDDMRWVRTMLAVDTLRLLLERYEEENVLLAITSALRRIYERYAREQGVDPLAHSAAVLTSTNITAAVLHARTVLQGSPRSRGRLATPMHDRSSSWMARQSLQSPPASPRLHARNVSPGRSESCYAERRHTHAKQTSAPASPSREATSELSPRRVSILAREGMHVLMNEKIAAFQHRAAPDRLPTFKIRRDSDASIASAARRRERSMHYGLAASGQLRTAEITSCEPPPPPPQHHQLQHLQHQHPQVVSVAMSQPYPARVSRHQSVRF